MTIQHNTSAQNSVKYRYSLIKTIVARPLASALLIIGLASGGSLAHAALYDAELSQIQQRWAQAVYKTPSQQVKYSDLQSLSGSTANLAKQYPNVAAVLVWDGIVNSTLAAVKGGLGALSLAEKSRDQLERAKQLEPNALGGSVFTSLGTLYAKVPGWPLSFGNAKKAEAHFKQALQINPQGIDINYFYAEYLADQGQKTLAMQHLKKAMQAPARPGRPVADAGRRLEARQLLTKLQKEG